MSTPLIRTFCWWGAMLSLLMALAPLGPAQATDYSWNNTGTGPWDTPGNWTPNGVPGINDDANITNGGTAQIANSDAAAANLHLDSGALQLSSAYGLSVGIEGTGTPPETTAFGVMIIGQNGGTGTVTQNHASSDVTVAGELTLGQTSGSQGTYNLTQGALNVTGNWHHYEEFDEYGMPTGEYFTDYSTGVMYVGQVGSGTLNQGVGTTNTIKGDLILGYQTGGSGVYNLSGGTAVVNQDGFGMYGLVVGFSGTGQVNQSGGNLTTIWPLVLGYLSGGRGTFNQTGGTTQVNNSLILGKAADSSGTYEISGSGTQLTAGGIVVGDKGRGEFTQSDDASVTAKGTLEIGYSDGSSGTYTLSGGTLSTFNTRVGFHGNGEFIQTGGTHTLVSPGEKRLWLGSEKDVTGTYSLKGGSLSALTAYVGDRGHGEFTQETGTTFTAGSSLYLGNIAPDPVIPGSGEGIYTMNGGTLTVSSIIFVGNYGKGTFLQYAGAVSISGNVWVGLNAGSQGTYELSGDSLSVNTRLAIGRSGTGDFIQTGGTVTLGTGSSPGRLNVGGIDGTVSSAPSTGTGTYDLSGTGVLNVNSNTSGNGFIVIGSGYSETGGVGKQATGTFTQDGGEVHLLKDNVSGYMGSLYVGDQGGVGIYDLKDGQLTSYYEYIGNNRSSVGAKPSSLGTFNQSGGSNAVDRELWVGQYGGDGTYNLTGGTLSAKREVIGYSTSIANYVQTTGSFSQGTGSTNTITGTESYDGLQISPIGHSTGTYAMNGGTLNVTKFMVGYTGNVPSGEEGLAVFNINSAAAQVNVSQSLIFGKNAQFSAVPGATINMTGSQFDNRSTNPGALSGLANLKLVYIGGTTTEDHFEVAGQDYGAVLEGFDSNFALGTLKLGDETGNTGYVGLYDAFNNDLQTGFEALYVFSLYVGLGSILDLHNLNLYCQSFTNLGEIRNGAVQVVVPLPPSVLLLGSGLLGLLALGGRRRRRRD